MSVHFCFDGVFDGDDDDDCDTLTARSKLSVHPFFLKMGYPHLRMEFTRALVKGPPRAGVEPYPGYHLFIGRSENFNFALIVKSRASMNVFPYKYVDYI